MHRKKVGVLRLRSQDIFIEKGDRKTQRTEMTISSVKLFIRLNLSGQLTTHIKLRISFHSINAISVIITFHV